jgi:hypothetical protein
VVSTVILPSTNLSVAVKDEWRSSLFENRRISSATGKGKTVAEVSHSLRSREIFDVLH